jgi:hypothetical protein
MLWMVQTAKTRFQLILGCYAFRTVFGRDTPDGMSQSCIAHCALSARDDVYLAGEN